jgi:hypothetical protein
MHPLRQGGVVAVALGWGTVTAPPAILERPQTGGHVSNALNYPNWQELYVAAMLEMNSRKMKAKIADAEDAIRSRMLGSKVAPEERQAIVDALNALKFLNR